MVPRCALECVQEAVLAVEPDSEGQNEGHENHEQVLAGQTAPAHGELIEDQPLSEVEQSSWRRAACAPAGDDASIASARPRATPEGAR